MSKLIWLRFMVRAVWEGGPVISSLQLVTKLSANAPDQPCCSISQYFYTTLFDRCDFRLVPPLIAYNLEIKKHNANLRLRRSDCG